jgi:Fibronectin type III domain
MKMNIFKKLPQAMVRVIATGALLVATALGSVAMTAGVAGAVATGFTATLVPGAAAVTAAWTADGNAASTTVTAVDITNSANGGQSCTVLGATVATCQITGLTLGDSYYFSLVETTTTGVVQAAVKANYPAGLLITSTLSAPVAYNAGSGGIAVAWTADGSSSGYTVTAFANSPVNILTATQQAATSLVDFTSAVNTSLKVGNIIRIPTGATTFLSGTVTAIASTTAFTADFGVAALAAGAGTAVAGLVALYTVAQSKIVAGICTALTGTGRLNCIIPSTGLLDTKLYTFAIDSTTFTGTATTTITALTYHKTGAGSIGATAVDAGGGVATVTFPTDGVAATYVVTADGAVAGAGAGTCEKTGQTVTVLTSCQITGLSSDTYTITVVASNGETGNLSDGTLTLALSTALKTPTAALLGYSTTKLYQATVTFTADGVSPVYTVYTGTTGGAGYQAADTTVGCIVGNSGSVPTGVQTCTVSGLAASSTNYFWVKASGSPIAVATASAESSGLSTTAVLTGVSVTNPGPIANSMTVNITADGKATKYVVSVLVSATGAVNTFVLSTTLGCVLSYATPIANATQLTCQVTGLTPGTSYQFVVTPSGGTALVPETSGASVATAAQVLGGPSMAAPVVTNGVTTSHGYTQTVTWVADGIASLYYVTYGTAAPIAAGLTGAGTNAAVTVGNLATGVQANDAVVGCTVANTTTPLTGTQTCNVTVPAGTWNYVVYGTGNLDSNLSLISVGKTTSSAIGGVSAAAAGSGSVKVSWTSDGVATGYQAVAYLGGIATTHYCVNSSTTAIAAGTQSCTIIGLTNGNAYSFVVSPANGNSTPSSLGLPYTVGIAPLPAPSLSWAASQSLKASWTADGVANWYTVTFIEATPTLGGSFGTCSTGDSSVIPTGTISCTALNLSNGRSYVATVTAYGNGTTSASSPTTAIPVLVDQYSAPGAPVVTAAALTSTTVSVAWTAPVVTGGSVIGGYLISALSADGLSSGTCGQSAVAGTMVCSNLKAGTTYKVSVYAAGPFGVSAAGTASVTTPAASLAAETGATFNRGTATLTASAKAALTSLASSLHDGASITVRGWGQTKAIATARANAVASFLLNAGAAVHTTIIGIVAKTATNAKVYQTA